MLNANNQFICDYTKDCGKPVTRVLRYFVDGPTSCALDPKTEAFCDEHAEAEMVNLQKPGFFFFGSGDNRVDGTVHELENWSIEDCCSHETNEHGETVVRVGKNVDPRLWGYAPKSRGTTFVLGRSRREVPLSVEVLGRSRREVPLSVEVFRKLRNVTVDD